MLPGQDLGRCQQGSLSTRLGHRHHRCHGNHRFSRTHLTLNKSIHRVRFGHVLVNFLQDMLLIACQRERQTTKEALRARPSGASHRRLRSCLYAPLHQGALQHERLMKAQGVSGMAPVLFFAGAVDFLQSVLRGHQVLGGGDIGRNRVWHHLQHIQDHPQGSGDLPTGNLRGCRIERNRTLRPLFTLVTRELALLKEFIVGVSELSLTPVETYLASEDSLRARHQIF